MKTRTRNRAILLVAAMVIITAASIRSQADQTGTCGAQMTMTTIPFDDVLPGNIFFCSIAEAYFSALTNGTGSNAYSPADNVTRAQMAAFTTRAMDQSLKRGSRRAALKQFWTPTSANDLTLTTVGSLPQLVESDGADLWVASFSSNTVSRVRASDGKLLETWTGASGATGVLAAKGLIFVTGSVAVSGPLYQIDPSQPAGAVATVTNFLGAAPQGISFDGARIWTANFGGPGSVSIVTLSPTVSVTTVTAGFTSLQGILYDGANIWVTDFGSGNLFKLDSNGAIIQTVTVGNHPLFPLFDGTNIWVPNNGSASVTVVRASTGAILATLTGNGLNGPQTAAFDGERVLVTNFGVHRVSLWKAADLSPLGSVSTGPGTFPKGACSDGLNFWVTLTQGNKLARF